MTAPLTWPAGSPERIVEDAFAAFRARDGRALAALTANDSLNGYREHVLNEFDPRWNPSLNVESYRRHHPEMPVEVAEWQLRQMDHMREEHLERMLREFAGVESPEALRMMSAPELLDRALRAAPEQVIAWGRCTVLGHVEETPERAYVLFRLGLEEIPPPFLEPSVATLVREAGDWRLVLDAFVRWGVPGFRNMAFGEEPPPGGESPEE